MSWCFLNKESCWKKNALFIQLLWYVQYSITQTANTSNVDFFWHKLFQWIFWAAELWLYTLKFIVLPMCTSQHPVKKRMHCKLIDALYVDLLIPSSSFVPRVSCSWCIQDLCNLSTITSLLCGFLSGGLVSLPRTQKALWLTFKSKPPIVLIGKYSISWQTLKDGDALQLGQGLEEEEGGKWTSHLKTEITVEQASTPSTWQSQQATSTPHKRTLPFTLHVYAPMQACPWHSVFQRY